MTEDTRWKCGGLKLAITRPSTCGAITFKNIFVHMYLRFIQSTCRERKKTKLISGNNN